MTPRYLLEWNEFAVLRMRQYACRVTLIQRGREAAENAAADKAVSRRPECGLRRRPGRNPSGQQWRAMGENSATPREVPGDMRHSHRAPACTASANNPILAFRAAASASRLHLQRSVRQLLRRGVCGTGASSTGPRVIVGAAQSRQWKNGRHSMNLDQE